MTGTIQSILQITMALIGAYGGALWLALVIWTFRDIQKRSRDPFVRIFATLLVLLFNLPGLVIYLVMRPPETLDDLMQRSLAAEAMMREVEGAGGGCTRCGARGERTFRFCPSCGATMRRPCGTCDELVRVEWRVCPYCAATLGKEKTGAPSRDDAPVTTS